MDSQCTEVGSDLPHAIIDNWALEHSSGTC
jgi:hypothetical protein